MAFTLEDDLAQAAHLSELTPEQTRLVLAARLLAAFGEDRAQWSSAEDLLHFSGVAPVTQQSGKMRVVHRRRKAPAFLHQTFVEWAAESWKHCAWARAFYLCQKAKGKGFHSIMRCLAYKWIRILFAAWKNHTPYDENVYLQTLRKRGNPLCEYLGA